MHYLQQPQQLRLQVYLFKYSSIFYTFWASLIYYLIQSGGLGFMTFAILAALSLSPKVGLKQQMMAQDSLGQTSLSKVTFVAKGVVAYTFLFELIGTIILTTAFTPVFGFARGLYYAIFIVFLHLTMRVFPYLIIV